MPPFTPFYPNCLLDGWLTITCNLTLWHQRTNVYRPTQRDLDIYYISFLRLSNETDSFAQNRFLRSEAHSVFMLLGWLDEISLSRYSLFRNAEEVKQVLPTQITSPVKWEQLMHVIYSRDKGVGYPSTYELGPGSQLGSILHMVNRTAHANYMSITVWRSEEILMRQNSNFAWYLTTWFKDPCPFLLLVSNCDSFFSFR